MEKTYIVIILYNPSTEILSNWLKLSKDNPNFTFCFVDNSSMPSEMYTSTYYHYLSLGSNRGIATAQNIGTRKALDDSAKYVIFFDQDSKVDVTYMSSILEEYKRLKSLVPNLAMLGPTIVNKETGENYKNGGTADGLGFVKTNNLISSGTIVDTETLKVVGFMDDNLFIDAVDFEWCWRAINKGYICGRTEKVKLPHKVGQKNITILGMSFIVSSPIRYYYQYRNWLWLMRRAYVPKTWKRKNSVRRIVELFIIPFFTDRKIETIQYMCKGIKDGLSYHTIL